MSATTVSNITPKGAYDQFVALFAKAESAIVDLDNAYTAEWAASVANLEAIEACGLFGLEQNAEGFREARIVISLGKVHNLPAAGTSVYEMARAIRDALAKDVTKTIEVVAAYAGAKNPKSTRGTFVSALGNVGRAAGTTRTDEQRATSHVNGVVKYFAALTDEQRATLKALLG
jgi:hypothetical protein